MWHSTKLKPAILSTLRSTRKHKQHTWVSYALNFYPRAFCVCRPPQSRVYRAIYSGSQKQVRASLASIMKHICAREFPFFFFDFHPFSCSHADESCVMPILQTYTQTHIPKYINSAMCIQTNYICAYHFYIYTLYVHTPNILTCTTKSEWHISI